MKKSLKSFLSIMLTVVMLFGCVQSGLTGVYAVERKNITFALSEEWAVQGKYCYLYLSAKNTEGLQGGTIIISYDKDRFMFYPSLSESVKSCGLKENPYFDSIFSVSGKADYYDKTSYRGFVSFGFTLDSKSMTAAEASIPENGEIPLFKFVFRLTNDIPADDYEFNIVEATAEVGEKLVKADTINSTVHIYKKLTNEFNQEVGYNAGNKNKADPPQFTDCRYSLIKYIPDVKTVNFDFGAGSKTDARPAAINFNAFGDSNQNTKLKELETIIFSVPFKNLDNASQNSASEYPYRAFSDLDKLERVIMEFSEEDTNNYSRFFTDDGIIYIRDVDSNGNYLETSKIYFIPQNRQSSDIYLSDKVSGIYGNTANGNALMYLSDEQAEKLVFHVVKGAKPNGIPQEMYFNSDFYITNTRKVKLNAETYAPGYAVSETEYNCDTAGELVIPFCFNGYSFDKANSSVQITSSDAKSVKISKENALLLASDALKSGADMFKIKIAVKDSAVPYEVTVNVSHTCKKDSGKIVKNATCTANGDKQYFCTLCGNYISSEIIPMLGHSSDSGTVTKKNTCTEDGEKIYKCTRCGEVMKTEVLKAAGHTEDKGTVTKQPSCTEEGERVYKCTVCGIELRKEAVSANGHKNDSGTVTKQPTCTEEGERVYKCTVCGVEIKREVIPAKGHSDKELGTVKSATCKQSGIKRYECKDCGRREDRSYSDSNAHIWKKAFGLTWRCSVCGTEKISTSKPSSSYVEKLIDQPTDPTPPVTDPQPPVTDPQPPVTDLQPPVTDPQPPVTDPKPPVTDPKPPVTDPKPPVTLPPIPSTDPSVPPITTPSVMIPKFSNAKIVLFGDNILIPPGKADEFRADASQNDFTLTDKDGRNKANSLMLPGDKFVLKNNGSEKTFNILVKYDVNGDGKVNSGDARAALRCALKLEKATKEQTIAITASETGKITSSNARTILRVALKLEEI